MDYYGKKLATCSSDRTIKVFNVQQNVHSHLVDLLGHEGPVWQVAWAHPKFGTKLASCSYDRKVIIWSEDRGHWSKAYVYTGHTLSVNSISWAPHDLGLILVCGSSDGSVSVLTHTGSDWHHAKFEAHLAGVNSVSWAPTVIPPNLATTTVTTTKFTPVASFASGGSDNLVKIWQLSETGDWQKVTTLEGHTDWVRDVAWAPNAGLPYSTLASCSQDGLVLLWKQSEGEWSNMELCRDASSPVWRVSWSVTGGILAVARGDSSVTLWKEFVGSGWTCISNQVDSVDDESNPINDPTL